MISTTIFQNITRKSEKIIYSVFTILGLLLRPILGLLLQLYHELGLESLEKRRWYRKLFCFYKIFRSQSPQYLLNIIPQFKVKHNFFKNSFFSSVIIEWNKLDLNIRNSENSFIFKEKFLKFIRPSGNSVFKCYSPKGIKLLMRLRLGLSHLPEHKFKHGLLDSLTQSVVVVKILKHRLISFCTVPIIPMKD